MADPPSVSSSVITLAIFALQASTLLFDTICSFQSHDKRARALLSEVEALRVALQSLLDMLQSNPNVDLGPLKSPLHRCGKVCNEYGSLITQFTKNPSGSQPNVKDWITQKYLLGDINDFKEMLGVYKSTINIATIRITITPNMLEWYKSKICDAIDDLEGYSKELDERLQRLSVLNAKDADCVEWQAMLEEKESTQRGLQICAQASAAVEQLELGINEPPQFSERPSAYKHVKSVLGAARESFESAASRLRSHEASIDRHIEAVKSTSPPLADAATQMATLQQVKESIHQCTRIVSDAGETSTVEQRNIFEDITLAENAYNVATSNTGALFAAKRIDVKEKGRNISGQMSDESFQQTIAALTKLDMRDIRPSTQPEEAHVTGQGPADRSDATSGFRDRYGRGYRLSPTEESGNVSQAEGLVLSRNEFEAAYAPIRQHTG